MKLKRVFFCLCGVLLTVIITTGSILTSNKLLSTAINLSLPQGWKITMPAGLSPRWQGTVLDQLTLSYQNCPLISIKNSDLTWYPKRNLIIENATIDYACIEKLPDSEDNTSYFSLNALLLLIPNSDVSVKSVEWANVPDNLPARLKAILANPTSLKLNLEDQDLTAELLQQAVIFSATFANNNAIGEIIYRPSEDENHQLTFSAKLQEDLIQIPIELEAEYLWQLPASLVEDKELQKGKSQLNWQQNENKHLVGNWLLKADANPENQLNMPFYFDYKTLEIKQGRFDWQLNEAFPLQGFISTTLTPNEMNPANFFPILTTLRISLLSQNEYGKGNIVISNQEGELNKDSLNLPLQLTGNIKYDNFVLYSSAPLDFQGKFDDLKLRFLPTSLIRITGKDRYLTIQDLRFPLAGIRVDKHGLNGRLQAIFKGESPDFSDIKFHLDGFANNFKMGFLDFFEDNKAPNAVNDLWKWKLWGGSTLKAFNSKINLSGRGNNFKQLAQITEFKADLSKIQLSSTTIPQLELTLTDKINFNYKDFTLTGGMQLATPYIAFRYGGELPKVKANLNLAGELENLRLKGTIQSEEIGPLRLFARRQLTAKSSELVGRLYWPEQHAKVFQSLFPFRSNWIINKGIIKGESSFSAGSEKGFIAGGHLSVRNAGISMPNGELTGISFSLPFLYKNSSFEFGHKQPLEVNIAEIRTGDLLLTNGKMKINGHYPYSHKKQLNLSQLKVDLFGGRLNVQHFALPQKEIAFLNLEQIDFEKIMEFVQYQQQLDLKGKANATLPFWLSGNPCFICDGLLMQTENAHIKFSPEILEVMKSSGYTEQILLQLVNESEVSELRGLVNVGKKGDMVLDAKLKLHANNNQTKVNLNYNHKENIFELWQLINYSSNFEQKLEHYLYQKLDK